MTCPWCDGVCQETDLAPLLHPDLAWLWNQLADCADRRGDPELTSGSVGLKMPSAPEERSAAVGLLGGRPLSAGQVRRVDLVRLGDVLARRHPRLTPGVAAAHGARRRLAQRARSRAEQIDATAGLRRSLTAAISGLPEHLPGEMDPDAVWTRLHRAGWISRLIADDDREKRITLAAGVLARLPRPPARVDRRVLIPGDPHALDEGTVLAGLVLAVAGVAGAAAGPGRPGACSASIATICSADSSCSASGHCHGRCPATPC
ncbi:TIGR02679 domain-containing protein [Catenulispora yoronensis]